MSFPANASQTPEPELLLEQLSRQFPQPGHYWVSFSGGLDSSVLLHLLAAVRTRLGAPLSAIHVDHALQPGSDAWAGHCRQECDRLGIPLISVLVDATAADGESPEAAARAARYAAIAAAIGPGAMLLTAHHRDDQAETLLLQLLRGAGIEGLAAMPVIREWNGGWHARPLLGWRRAALRAWAVAKHLRWIEDPSNAASVADRNYLRHQVLPALTARWPGAVESIARSAVHCAEAADAIRLQARQDLEAALSADRERVRVDALRDLPAVRARNVLRLWLRDHGTPPLPFRRLVDALDQLCRAGPEAAVRIAWAGVELRRFRDEVWLLSATRAVAAPGTRDWVGEEMQLGPGLGRVRRRHAPGGIDAGAWSRGCVQIAYRDARLRCQPAGRAGSRPFKKIAQEFGIPPWLRYIVPVVLIDGKVAAIANCCVCEPFGAAPGASGWVIEWIPD